MLPAKVNINLKVTEFNATRTRICVCSHHILIMNHEVTLSRCRRTKYIIFILTIIFGNIIIYIFFFRFGQHPLLVELIYVIKMFREIDTARWCRTSVTNIFYNRVLLKKLRIPIYFLGTLNNIRNVVKHSTLSFLRMNISGQKYGLGW